MSYERVRSVDGPGSDRSEYGSVRGGYHPTADRRASAGGYAVDLPALWGVYQRYAPYAQAITVGYERGQHQHMTAVGVQPYTRTIGGAHAQ